MKLNIKKETLLKGVNFVEKNVGKNLSLPILNNILIRTKNNEVELISLDLEIGVLVRIPSKVEEEGSIVIPPRVFIQFLQSIPEGNLLLKTENKTLFIEHENYNTSIKGEEDKDFPVLPKVDTKQKISIPIKNIVQALSQVQNSIAQSELKPELTGVLFQINQKEIKLVATDSFRLSEKQITPNKVENINNKLSVIIPEKAISEIVRNFKDIEGDMVFHIDKNQIVAHNQEDQNIYIQVVSKLIEGDYPEYSQIIPKEFNTKTIISKKEFLQQVRAASIFTSKINDITLSIKDKSVDIHTENYDIGDFNASLTASTEGEKQDIVFNYHYLLDGLNNIEGDEVILKINQPDKPTILESTEKKDYFYILMPIRASH